MQKQEKYGLMEEDIFSISAVVQENEKIEKAILFGSRATGNFRNGSDIDIALKGKQLCLQDILDVSIALDELFLPYKFDLVIYNRIKEKSLLQHIDQYGISLNKLEKT